MSIFFCFLRYMVLAESCNILPFSTILLLIMVAGTPTLKMEFINDCKVHLFIFNLKHSTLTLKLHANLLSFRQCDHMFGNSCSSPKKPLFNKVAWALHQLLFKT